MTNEKVEAGVREPFLARWSRVKEEQTRTGPADTAKSSIGEPLEGKDGQEPHPARTSPEAAPPLPSVESLTAQSDFAPFMARDVDPGLRNLAMKKLFTDPHYNIMDRLDIYIDDYSTHPPLSIDVIRQMSISKTLGLFDDEEKAEADAAATVEPAGEPPPLQQVEAAAPSVVVSPIEIDAATATPTPATAIKANQ